VFFETNTETIIFIYLVLASISISSTSIGRNRLKKKQRCSGTCAGIFHPCKYIIYMWIHDVSNLTSARVKQELSVLTQRHPDQTNRPAGRPQQQGCLLSKELHILAQLLQPEIFAKQIPTKNLCWRKTKRVKTLWVDEKIDFNLLRIMPNYKN